MTIAPTVDACSQAALATGVAVPPVDAGRGSAAPVGSRFDRICRRPQTHIAGAWAYRSRYVKSASARSPTDLSR